MNTASATPRLPIVVLISGDGTNLQALIDSAAAGLPVEIRAVISNRPDAAGLQRAQRAGIPVHAVDHMAFGERAAFDRALCKTIDRYQPALIVMAGFMRILGRDFIERYPGRVLNIHPSLLPAYRGLDTHRRVLAAGEGTHGVSIHFVTNELDGGPVVAQARVPVLPGDTAEQLAVRVRAAEHALYPLVIRWFAEGRLKISGDTVTLDNVALTQPVTPLAPAAAARTATPGRAP